MTEVEMNKGHIPGRCLSDSERFVLMAELVDLLITQRPEACPGCLIEALEELAEEGGRLWRDQIQAEPPACRH